MQVLRSQRAPPGVQRAEVGEGQSPEDKSGTGHFWPEMKHFGHFLIGLKSIRSLHKAKTIITLERHEIGDGCSYFAQIDLSIRGTSCVHWMVGCEGWFSGWSIWLMIKRSHVQLLQTRNSFQKHQVCQKLLVVCSLRKRMEDKAASTGWNEQSIWQEQQHFLSV